MQQCPLSTRIPIFKYPNVPIWSLNEYAILLFIPRHFNLRLVGFFNNITSLFSNMKNKFSIHTMYCFYCLYQGGSRGLLGKICILLEEHKLYFGQISVLELLNGSLILLINCISGLCNWLNYLNKINSHAIFNKFQQAWLKYVNEFYFMTEMHIWWLFQNSVNRRQNFQIIQRNFSKLLYFSLVLL